MPDAKPTLYVMDISYFSGKVESYLRFAEFDYERVHVTHRTLVGLVGRETGVAQVPAMRLPDGRWLRESSAMIRWLEEQGEQPKVRNEDPAEAFLAALVEDYCDEWLWRPAMWWRWMPPTSRRELGLRIAREVLPDIPLPEALLARVFIRRQENAWLRGDGMGTAADDAVRDAYLVELDSLQAILASRPFLGGGRPSMIDVGFMGPMFRHFACDPDSAPVMRERAPLVWEWVHRMWDARRSELPHSAAHEGTAGSEFDALFGRVCSVYLPYLEANARAIRHGRRRFDFAAGPFEFRGVRANRQRAECRTALRRAFAVLSEPDRGRVHERLALAGGLGPLLDDDVGPDSGYPALQLPLRPKGSPTLRQRLRLLVGDSFGT